MLRNKELVEMGLDTARRSDLNLGDILSRTAMVLGNPRVSNALAWGSLLWGVGKPLYEAWKDRREERDYRFVVTEGSVLYYYLKTYIVDTIPREEQPSLSIQALVDVENEIDDLYLKNSKFERIVEENSVVGHMEVELAGVQVLIYLANSGEVPGSTDSGSAPAHGGATNRVLHGSRKTSTSSVPPAQTATGCWTSWIRNSRKCLSRDLTCGSTPSGRHSRLRGRPRREHSTVSSSRKGSGSGS